MEYKIKDEQPWQILTNAVTISPSQTGYQLEVAADGKNYSPLFSVSSGVTRQVTNLSSGSYYRLKGNVGEVVINWVRSCNSGGGSADLTNYWTSAQTVDYVDEAIASAMTSGISLDGYWTSAQTESAISDAVSGLATEQYVQNALSGVDLSNYWTSGETETAINSAYTILDAHITEVEQVTASGYTELHTGLMEVSGRSVFNPAEYYTSAQTEAAITGKSYITSAYVSDALTAYTQTTGFSTINGSAITNGGNIEIQAGGDMSGYMTSGDAQVISTALNDLNTNKADVSDVEEIAEVTAGAINTLQTTKVGSEDIGIGLITKIVKIEETPYQDLVDNDEIDSSTLYVVVPDSM